MIRWFRRFWLRQTHPPTVARFVMEQAIMEGRTATMAEICDVYEQEYIFQRGRVNYTWFAQ